MGGYSDVLSESTRGIHSQIVARDQYFVAMFIVADSAFDDFTRCIYARGVWVRLRYAAMPGCR